MARALGPLDRPAHTMHDSSQNTRLNSGYGDVLATHGIHNFTGCFVIDYGVVSERSIVHFSSFMSNSLGE